MNQNKTQLQLIHQYVDFHGARQADALAIRYLDETLSYHQLSITSNQLANTLLDIGVKRHDRIGIYMDKSLYTAIALYGIMKAGATYVPLDPAAPIERICGLIDDCGMRYLVTSTSKRRNVASINTQNSSLECVIGLKADTSYSFNAIPWQRVLERPTEPVNVQINEDDLAYIIYTSGSTGTPKGIMHTHYSGLSFSRWAVDEYQLGASDRLSNHAPLHFDLSIMDYFSAAIAGSCTVIVPQEYTKLPASYSKLLEEHKVTVLYTVPFALIQMLLRGALEERDLSALRWAIFGGEPFPSAHLRALCDRLPHVKFDNIYGPAEINGCSHYTVEHVDHDDSPVPIGPVASIADGIVVDKNDEPVNIGDIGELLVRTPTMMRGYWQRDDLNQKAFSYRSNSIGYKERFFRTGDLVQELENGVLRFVGRKDRQTKIRGYRVELDEIELALTAIEPVEEAAVYTIDESDGSKRLRSELTLKQADTLQSADIVKRLKTKLPWYAIPAHIIIRAEFPRTVTGKIDRRRLAELAQEKYEQQALQGETASPEDIKQLDDGQRSAES